jgi:hypothetical protein
MIEIAGDIQYGLAEQQVVYLRGYADLPEMDTLEMWANKVRDIIQGTIAYSIEIVTLADSTLSGPERPEMLATYLDGLLRPVLERPQPALNLTLAQLDEILADVRAQDTLLDGLNAAQPKNIGIEGYDNYCHSNTRQHYAISSP